MSRQPNRPGKVKNSKDTKSKTTSADKQPTSLFEIVPGKFNENDWNAMLELDDSQEFVWELVDEIVDNAEKIILKSYLDKQTIPYTINEAKKAILHIIDWQFLPKDQEDEENNIDLIVEDTEPNSCIIDSWAQGYVQSLLDEKKLAEEDTHLTSKSKFNMKKEASSILLSSSNSQSFLEELSKSDYDRPASRVESEKGLFNVQDGIIRKKAPAEESDKACVSKKRISHASVKKKLDFVDKSYVQDVEKSAETIHFGSYYEQEPVALGEDEKEPNVQIEITELKKNAKSNRIRKDQMEMKKLEESISKAPVACQSILKTLLSRPNAMREIEIDSNGNIASIAKLDAESSSLGGYGTKTRFGILDSLKASTSNDLAGVIASRNRTILSKNQATSQPKPVETVREIAEDENELILEPAPGVVYRVGNATRAGPRRSMNGNKQHVILDKSESFLKPIMQHQQTKNSADIQQRQEMRRLTIEQLIENPNNYEKSFRQPNKLKPIPPINNASNSSTSVN